MIQDWVSLFVLGMSVSILLEYWLYYFWAKKRKSLFKENSFWYKFFFCSYCIIGKVSFISAFYYQPFMFLEVAPYPIWSLFQFLSNFLIINFVTVICYAILGVAIDLTQVEKEE